MGIARPTDRGVGEEAECRGREGVRGFVCGGVEGVAIYEGRNRV